MRSLGLEDLIAPISTEAFLTDIYGKGHRHIQGPRGRFYSLFGWDDLNAILRLHRLDWPRLRLARDATGAPVEVYTEEVTRRNGAPYRRVIPELLYTKLAEGFTLVIDRVDQLNDPINELAFQLESDLGASSWANLYASWTTTRGFDVHWDDHDVFVLQIDGRKTWQVFGPTRKWPLYRDMNRGPTPPQAPLAQVTTEPGDVLYIPHGWWHLVQALDEPSLHITLGVNPDNGIDLLRWLVDQCRDEEAFRARLPRHAPPDQQQRHIAVLKKLLHARLEDPALLRDFVSHSDAHSPPRSRFSLPYAPELARIREALHPHSLIVLPTPRASVAEVDGRIELLAAGKRMVFKTETAAVIKTLASVHKITLGELLHTAAPTLNEEETRDLIAHLVNLGILAMLDKECDGIVGSGGQ